MFSSGVTMEQDKYLSMEELNALSLKYYTEGFSNNLRFGQFILNNKPGVVDSELYYHQGSYADQYEFIVKTRVKT